MSKSKGIDSRSRFNYLSDFIKKLYFTSKPIRDVGFKIPSAPRSITVKKGSAHGPYEQTPLIKESAPDYSKRENQIGCGYCKHEANCPDYDRKINKAKLGCERFIHHEL